MPLIIIIMQSRWHLFFGLAGSVECQVNYRRFAFGRKSAFGHLSVCKLAVTMYGFVNQALQEFVIRESSFETWEEILYVYLQNSHRLKPIERSFRQSKSIDVKMSWIFPSRLIVYLDLCLVGRKQISIWEKQENSTSGGYMMIKIHSTYWESLPKFLVSTQLCLCTCIYPLFRSLRGF